MMRPTLRVVSLPPRRLMSNAVDLAVPGRNNFLSFGQIGCEGAFHRITKRNVTFFFSLAANQNGLRAQPNIVEIDSSQFRISDSASVKQFQHEPVTFREGRDLWHFTIDHGIHFFNRRDARKFLGKLWRGDQLRRILLHHAFPRQPTIKRPHRRQVRAPRKFCLIPFIKLRKKSAHHDVIDLFPSARAGVGGEEREITVVGLDGVRRSVALAQMAQKIGNGLCYYRFSWPKIFSVSPCLREFHLAFARG